MIFSLHNLGIVILLSVFTATLYPAYGQIGNLTSLPPEPAPTESIKIVDPITGEKVVAGQELKVSGESSDDPSKDCTVSVIVNNVRPYQNAFPVGAAGDGDYSKWNFVVSENYTGLIQGENKITAKLTCPPPLATRWYSVFVTGEGASEDVNSNTTQPPAQPQTQPPAQPQTQPPAQPQTQPPAQPQLSPPLTEAPQPNLSSTQSNLTTATTTTPTLEAEEEVEEEPSSTTLPLPTTSTNTTTTLSPPESESQPLHVSIAAQKNPISRGDNQSITIKVTDSNSRAVPDAEIDGVLIYPGDNYEKDFDGVTDLNGNFVYPWIIGENGDLGELVVQIEVTSPGYEPQTVTGSFNLVAPSEVSAVGNGNVTQLQSPPLTVAPQSNLSPTESNLTTATTTTTPPTLEPEEEPSITTPSLSTTSTNTSSTLGGNLQVSIAAQKNPISRGDNQSITIKVTDSNSRAVPDAEIDGVH